ncbi:MAG: PQQ-binding-like beta-propeller repeat protein [Planctomycetota bacterium]|nr:PQQ-binding-like beta-propeller repeat protein [Planctomycetota bacterium]
MMNWHFQFLVSGLIWFAAVGVGRSDDWPHWMGPRHDGVWRESGILKTFPPSGVRYRWRVPVDKGYTGPAVASGKLYIMDRLEEPSKPDTGSGGDQNAGKGKKNPGGFPELAGRERVLCLDVKTGKQIWKYEYDCVYRISYPEGPRTTPLVDGDRVYTLGAMGHLFCFQRDTGKKLWEKNLLETYQAKAPVWGFAAHLRVYGEKLVTLAGGDGSAVVCLNKQNGREIWKAQTAEEVGYAPPVPLVIGDRIQLVYWADEFVCGLQLDSGKENWKIRFPEEPHQRPIVTIMTPQVSGRKIMVSNFYNGSCVIEVAEDGKSAKKLWAADPGERNHKTGLNILMGAPLVRKNHIYGFAGKGEMRCVELDTGKQLWEEKTATRSDRSSYFATAFITPHEDRFLSLMTRGNC